MALDQWRWVGRKFDLGGNAVNTGTTMSPWHKYAILAEPREQQVLLMLLVDSPGPHDVLVGQQCYLHRERCVP